MAQTPTSEASSCSAIQEILHFLEHKGSSLSSHELFSKPDETSSTSLIYFLNIHLNILASGLFPSGSPTQPFF